MSKPDIPEGWNELAIRDVALIIGGGTPSTIDYENFNGNIPWLTPRDLSLYRKRYISKGERNISEKGFKSSNAKLLPTNSILLTTRAPIGYLAIAENEITTNQGFHSLIPYEEKVYYLFLYYLLKDNISNLINHASGSTFQELNGNTLKSLKFRFPSLTEQQAIAAVLSSFDDKIELLREQNKTLEKVAQAIYKRWFVDFEFPVMEPKNSPPFKEGRQPYIFLCCKKASLFLQKNMADGVVYQEGMMPEGRGGIDKTINNKSSLKTFRRQLRNNLTPAEAKLWTYLQNKQLEGRKFRRQFSVDNYILDFYCPSEKLGIELDGEVHNIETQAKYDIERDLFLSYYGIKVLRFENKVVFENSDYLLECIKKEFGKDTIPSAEGCHFSLPPRPSGTPPFKEGSPKGGVVLIIFYD